MVVAKIRKSIAKDHLSFDAQRGEAGRDIVASNYSYSTPCVLVNAHSPSRAVLKMLVDPAKCAAELPDQLGAAT